jgi:hypothetical protein
MLQFLTDQIDQLDLAVDQLAMRDRNFDRFALMLIDNVVELTLHEHARAKEHHNLLWEGFDKPKYDPKAVAAALGSSFDAKLRLAKITQLASEETADSILALHSLRNVVYHQGLRHEGILHVVALFYFELACELLRAFKPPFWGTSTSDRISHRAVKYLGQVSIIAQPEAFEKAYKRLSEVAGCFEQTLIRDLHADMASTIKDTDQDLDFLARNSPKPMTRNEAVVNAQLWPFAYNDAAKKWAANNGWTSAYDGKYVDWLSANYPWPTRSDPIKSWQRRLQSLQSEKNLHSALKKYIDFIRQTQEIRSKVGELACHLHGHIQQQMEYGRDK